MLILNWAEYRYIPDRVSDLNTSYVDIKLFSVSSSSTLETNLNTSYVDIKPVGILNILVSI